MTPSIATHPRIDPVAEIPTLAGRRVLITGATGFIGSHIAQRLLNSGAQARLLVRHLDRIEALNLSAADVVQGDLTRAETLAGCCDGIEIVIHCGAWLGRPYDRKVAYAINVDGTTAIASEALRAGVRRFVHASSVAVYGPVRAGVIDEDSPYWRGIHLYGDTKIAAEEALREAERRGLSIVIARPGLVYGPRSRGATIQLVRMVGKGFPAMVAGGVGYSRPIFIENLVDALLLCAVKPVAGQAFTLIDGNIRWRDYLKHYARMVGKTPRSVPYPIAWLIAAVDEARAFVLRRPPRLWRNALGYAVSQALFSTERAARLLGWRPRYSMEDAMELTKNWLIENGHLRVRPGDRNLA